MQQGLQILLIVALLAVVGILGWGLFNMFRGGPGNLSQRLMRARVIAQFIAIVLLMASLYFFAPR